MVSLDGDVCSIRAFDSRDPLSDFLLLNGNATVKDLTSAVNDRRNGLSGFIDNAVSHYISIIKHISEEDIAKIYRPHVIHYIHSTQDEEDYKREQIQNLSREPLHFSDIKVSMDLSVLPKYSQQSICNELYELIKKNNADHPFVSQFPSPQLDIENGVYTLDTSKLKKIMHDDLLRQAEFQLKTIEDNPDAYLASIKKKESKVKQTIRKALGLLDYTYLRPQFRDTLMLTTNLGGSIAAATTGSLLLKHGIAALPHCDFLIGFSAVAYGANYLFGGGHIKQRWQQENPPMLVGQTLFRDKLHEVYETLPEDLKEMLEHIKPDFFISPTLNYLSHTEDVSLFVGGSAAFKPTSHPIRVFSEHYQPEEDASNFLDSHRVIHLTNINFLPLYEEAKHVVHSFVGFSNAKWQAAALEELGKPASNALLKEHGNKQGKWWETPLYTRNSKCLYAAETLVELDHIYHNLTHNKHCSEIEAMNIIKQHMPKSGALFQEYINKEKAVLQALREGDEAKVTKLRLQDVDMPNTNCTVTSKQSYSSSQQLQ